VSRLRSHWLPISTPEAFTIEEAARRLGFRHRSSVYDLIHRGELVACHLGGGSLRVPADAIVEYLQRAVDRRGLSAGTTNLCRRTAPSSLGSRHAIARR
jgi:excisionase family DNA binding protein